MPNKLLVVCGPTATGKTALALYLARKYKGEVVSADSRQVFCNMDIGTGKEIPKGFLAKKTKISVGKGYKSRSISNFSRGDVRIWGYDIVAPKDDYNVSDYVNTATLVIKNIWQRKKLPIITGGTGFYIKALLEGIDSISIQPNLSLRKKLGMWKKKELVVYLKKVDPKKYDSMNMSDKNNPRRLIRAIEIAEYNNQFDSRVNKNIGKLTYDSILKIGLTLNKIDLDDRIKKRVFLRLKRGFKKEVLELLKNGVDWRYKSMQGTGYRQYEDYKKNLITWDEFISRWVTAEQKYAKRQMTWFKKDKEISWFDIKRINWMNNVEKVMQNWYYERDR